MEMEMENEIEIKIKDTIILVRVPEILKVFTYQEFIDEGINNKKIFLRDNFHALIKHEENFFYGPIFNNSIKEEFTFLLCTLK